MKRLSNYRSGDRAEDLGIVLLRSFCAVAPVPRQEDFGLVDAVATILRLENRLVYAEDSFAVQFKSRSETLVEYLNERFEALLNQELGLFIARVDLTKTDLRLYNVGTALSHPNINDAKGLVVYLDPAATTFQDDVLHISLDPPILQLTSSSLAAPNLQDKAYLVMKNWLKFDRWNRRARKMGIQCQICWQTNEMPSQGTTVLMWNPRRAENTLTEVLPAIQVIAGLASTETQLAVPVGQLISWMRSRGVDPDPTGSLSLCAWLATSREEMCKELADERQADIAVKLEFVANEPGRIVFWEQLGGADGPWTGHKHQCADADEVRALGFEVEVDPTTQKLATIGLGERWLAQRNCEVVEMRRKIFLLRRAKASDSEVRHGKNNDGTEL